MCCGIMLGLTYGNLYVVAAARWHFAFLSDIVAAAMLTACYMSIGYGRNGLLSVFANESFVGGASILIGNVAAAAIYRYRAQLPFHFRLREAGAGKD